MKFSSKINAHCYCTCLQQGCLFAFECFISNFHSCHTLCSKWVMMNQDTRKLQRVSDEVREEYLVFCPRMPRYGTGSDVIYDLCWIHVIMDKRKIGSYLRTSTILISWNECAFLPLTNKGSIVIIWQHVANAYDF